MLLEDDLPKKQSRIVNNRIDMFGRKAFGVCFKACGCNDRTAFHFEKSNYFSMSAKVNDCLAEGLIAT